MGANPIVDRYYVQTQNNNPNNGVPMNTLVVDQVVAGVLGQPVAANIVQLKAFYGRDNIGDGMVHVWDTTTPTTTGPCTGGTQWSCVLAVRLAIVAQSANPEKPDATGTYAGKCPSVTPIVGGAFQLPSVTWDDNRGTGSTTTTTLDVSVTGSATGIDWTCFRYKTFHVTTALRNEIWPTS